MGTKSLLLPLLLLATVPQAQAAVDFYIVGVEPLTLKPGESTVVNISIKNFGSHYASHFKAYFDPESKTPIYPVGPRKIYVSRSVEEGIPGMYFGSVIQGREVTLSIPVTVSYDTGFGQYLVPLKLEYSNPEGEQVEKTLSFGVEIAGEADITLGGKNTSPSRVYPDQEFTLSLTLENSGTGKAQNVGVGLEHPEGISGESSAYLGTLARDSKAKATFNLKSSKSAEPGRYNTHLLVSYREENLVEREVELPLEIFISERGDIDMEIAGLDTSPNLLRPGESFTLSLQVQNVGKQDAKAVKVEILPERSIHGEKTSYLGNLDSDDTSTAIFDLEVEPRAERGAVSVPLNIIYRDERGKEWKASKQISLAISPPEGTSYRLYGAVAGMGIIILFLLWRWRREEEEI